jgi:hypothetical protein
MLKRIHAVVAAAAMGTAALVAVPVAASASAGALTAPSISAVEVNPSPVVVTSKDKVTATFSFVTDNTATSAEAYTKPPGPGVETALTLAKTDLGSGKAKWSATRDFDRTSKPGTWNFRVYAKNADGDKNDAKGFEVRQVWETDFADFGASPGTVNRGEDVTLAGKLLVNSTDGWKALGGAKVYIAFRPLGGSWSRVASADTRGDGRFWVKSRADSTGWWRAEYEGSAVTNPTTSDSDRVDVRERTLSTRINGFDASPEPVNKGDKITVSGDLQIEGGRDGWRGYSGQKVNILFKPEGSGSWQYVTSDWTDRHGGFGADVTADTSGWWRAEYPGARGVDGSTSRGDWVSVNEPQPPAATRVTRFNAYPEPVKYGKFVYFKGKLQIWDGDSWAAYDGQKVGLFFKAAGSHKWEYVKTIWTDGKGRISGKVRDWHSGWWKVSFGGNSEAAGSAGRLDYVRVKK